MINPAKNTAKNNNEHVVESIETRLYITDMLKELSSLAKSSGEEDLHVLLELVSQAALNLETKPL